MRSLITAALVIFAQLVAPFSAQAASIADRVLRAVFLYPNPETPALLANPVVGPGVELVDFYGTSDIDFGPSTILIVLTFSGSLTPAAFHGWQFWDLHQVIDSFESVTVLASTLTDPFLVTYNDDNVWVDAGDGQHFEAGQYLLLSVPEPAAGWLLACGLALLGGRARRA